MNTAICSRCQLVIRCGPGDEGPIRKLIRHWLATHVIEEAA